MPFADVDECSLPGGSGCDPNALCTNTEGSYICRCLRGFEGDGRNCTGKVSFVSWYLSFSSLIVIRQATLLTDDLLQMWMNAQVLREIAVTRMQCVPTLRAPTFVAA